MYLCYGLHMMLNVVADMEGVGAAVLIRSCSPVTGMLNLFFFMQFAWTIRYATITASHAGL